MDFVLGSVRTVTLPPDGKDDFSVTCPACLVTIPPLPNGEEMSCKCGRVLVSRPRLPEPPQ
jgi:hypothetical protein